MHRLLTLLLTLLIPAGAYAQPLDVTFRYVPQPGDNVVRAFAPGEFNNWGPNNGGVIAIGAPSQMAYDAGTDAWRYTTALQVGQTYQYKFHYHLNESGSSWTWVSDPNNPRTNPADNNNSLITVEDPMVFELARRNDAGGQVAEVSAGVFASQAITALTFEVNGTVRDGLPFFDAATGIFRYTLDQPVPPGALFKITATDAGGTTVSDEIGFLAPDVVDAPFPAGLHDGINYDPANPTKVTLALFAPYKQFVHVVGDFNDWTVSDDFLLMRDVANPDSVRWWITIDGLTPGVEYGFQYLVDGQIRVADPYSEKILDPFNDGFLGSVYPNLKPYPTGKTSGMVGVFQTDQTPFAWTPFDRPAQKDLVIYELLVRDFIAAHSYAVLADTLDYLARLGVNAIELMPVAEFDGNESWGYNPAFHLAADKYYGSADDLKAFIDACHQRGIAVILDVVYNHATGQSPLVRLWNSSPTGDPSAAPTSQNPYANPSARHPFNVFNDLNHESTATRYWLDRANEHWLTEFNVDGFRYDLSKGFTQKSTTDVGVWSAYDAGRIATLKRMADRMWEVDQTAYIILEHFGDNQEEKELAEYRTGEGRPGMMLWGNLNHAYNEATMGYHNSGGSDFSWGYYGVRGWSAPNLVTYMESHDEQWLMFKNIAFGACRNAPLGGNTCNTNPGIYNVRSFETAYDRMKMAGAFFFTVPGPKMVWQFGELGYGYGPDGRECLRPGESLGDCPSGTASRVGNKPIRWNYREDPLRYKVYKTWAALLKLRNEHEVFTSSETVVSRSLDGRIKRLNLTHPSMAVTIVGNFGVAATSVNPSFPFTGMWYDYFTGTSFEVTDGNLNTPIALEAGEFHLYTSAPVETPEAGLITVDVEGPSGELPETVALHPGYPNPFNPVTTLTFDLPATAEVRLEVFDVLGRRVATLADGVLPAGTHEVVFQAGDLPSGLYLYRLRTGGQVFTRTLMLVK